MILHYLANSSSVILCQCALVYLLDHFVKPRFVFKGRSIVYAALIALVTAVAVYPVDTQYRFVVNASIYAIAILALYRGSVMRRLLLWALSIGLMFIVEFASVPLLLAMGWDPQTYTLTGWWLPVMNLTIAVFYWIAVLLIQSVASASEDKIGKKAWVMMGYCAFAAIFASFILYNKTEVIKSFMRNNTREDAFFFAVTSSVAVLLSVVLLMGLLLMMFSIIRQMNDTYRKAQAARHIAEEAELAAAQAKEAKEKRDTVARIRHDLKGHLQAIDILGRECDSERQEKYIAALMKGLGEGDAAS